jgi:hypothetical protein
VIPASARRTAESTLKTPCSVARPDEAAEPTIDPDTLQVDRGASTPLGSGLCTLRPGAAGEREQGGQVLAPVEWTWITSVDVPDFHGGRAQASRRVPGDARRQGRATGVP